MAEFPLEVWKGDRRGAILAQNEDGSVEIQWADGELEHYTARGYAQLWHRPDGESYLVILSDRLQ